MNQQMKDFLTYLTIFTVALTLGLALGFSNGMIVAERNILRKENNQLLTIIDNATKKEPTNAQRANPK